MKNKLFLVVILSQSLLMMGLIYFLWGKNNDELFIDEKFLFFLTIFSVVSFLFGLALYSKFLDKYEEGVRKVGVVKWYSANKGFGFIEHNQGEDLFVHQTEIRQSGFRYLNIGDQVEFEIGKSKKGPVALKVIRTKIGEDSENNDCFEEAEQFTITQSSGT